jgi:hypothetical protein
MNNNLYISSSRSNAKIEETKSSSEPIAKLKKVIVTHRKRVASSKDLDHEEDTDEPG